jgi:hypothetical protein
MRVTMGKDYFAEDRQSRPVTRGEMLAAFDVYNRHRHRNSVAARAWRTARAAYAWVRLQVAALWLWCGK